MEVLAEGEGSHYGLFFKHCFQEGGRCFCLSVVSLAQKKKKNMIGGKVWSLCWQLYICEKWNSLEFPTPCVWIRLPGDSKDAGLRTTGLEDLYPLPTWGFGIRPQCWRRVLCSCSHHMQKDSLRSISLRRDHSLVSQSPYPQTSVRLSWRGRDSDDEVFPYQGRGWPGLKLVPRALGQDLFQHLVHWKLRNTTFPVTTMILSLLREQFYFKAHKPKFLITLSLFFWKPPL